MLIANGKFDGDYNGLRCLGPRGHCQAARQRECGSRSIDALRSGSGRILHGIPDDGYGIRSESLRTTGRGYVRFHVYVRGGEC